SVVIVEITSAPASTEFIRQIDLKVDFRAPRDSSRDGEMAASTLQERKKKKEGRRRRKRGKKKPKKRTIYVRQLQRKEDPPIVGRTAALLERIDGGGRPSPGGPQPRRRHQPPAEHDRILRQFSEPGEQRVLLAPAASPRGLLFQSLRQRRRGGGPREDDRPVEQLVGGGRGRGADVGKPREAVTRVDGERRLLLCDRIGGFLVALRGVGRAGLARPRRGRLLLVGSCRVVVVVVPVERPGVVVVEGVSNHDHGWVDAAPLHLLPRRAPLGAAAPVVAPAHVPSKSPDRFHILLRLPCPRIRWRSPLAPALRLADRHRHHPLLHRPPAVHPRSQISVSRSRKLRRARNKNQMAVDGGEGSTISWDMEPKTGRASSGRSIQLKPASHRWPRIRPRPRPPPASRGDSTMVEGDEAVFHTWDSLWFFSNMLSPPSPVPKSADTSRPCVQQAEDCTPAADRRQESEGGATGEAEISEAAGCNTTEHRRKQGKKRRHHRFCCNEKEQVKGLVELQVWLLGLRSNGGVLTASRTGGGFAHCDGTVRLRRCGMPPLADGLAMKQHLRSWAHAVACAVS
ncbi:hypothetical protein GW17_00055099, partial [Ensete ventricosum]